ncbi:MAG: response regulator transcription factor [Suipraeoptans sp.]
MQQKILLVENDKVYADHLTEEIRKEGHDVQVVDNSLGAISNFTKYKYDLVIAQYNLDDLNGVKMLAVLKQIKPTLRSIVIINESDDNVESIEMDALSINVEHCLNKRKSLPLTIRYIDGLLKKDYGNNIDSQYLISPRENIEIDMTKHLVYKDGVEVKNITTKEYGLLILFLSNKEIPLSREEICKNLWTQDIEDIELRVIDGHIKNLRAKFNISSILSIRGYGYKWNESNHLPKVLSL